ncbi:hypothetical protein [Desulfosporosinus sp.]|nr:hypothetical protein [Desulfosporosinus sp.]
MLADMQILGALVLMISDINIVPRASEADLRPWATGLKHRNCLP